MKVNLEADGRVSRTHTYAEQAIVCRDKGFGDATCMSTGLHEAFYDNLESND